METFVNKNVSVVKMSETYPLRWREPYRYRLNVSPREVVKMSETYPLRWRDPYRYRLNLNLNLGSRLMSQHRGHLMPESWRALRIDPSLPKRFRVLATGPSCEKNLRRLFNEPDWDKMMLPSNAFEVPRGAGPLTPKPADEWDLLRAVLKVPVVQGAYKPLYNATVKQGEAQLRRLWRRSSTPTRALMVGGTVAVGGLVLSMDDPRQMFLENIGKIDLPVPGIPGMTVNWQPHGTITLAPHETITAIGRDKPAITIPDFSLMVKINVLEWYKIGRYF